ncbi:MAG: hypothetical protein IKE76_14140, partial [Clostridia bacterium]|nr:hypothetical protein [Clostridia bacterium]
EIEIPGDINLLEGHHRGYLVPKRLAKTKTQVRIWQEVEGREWEIMGWSKAEERYSLVVQRL